jgi:DNA-binding MarR family transcriptional regulator
MNNQDERSIIASGDSYYDYSSPTSLKNDITGHSDFYEIAYDIRRIRDAKFPAGYFADIAWDILLELARADHQGKQVQLSELGVLSAMPASTRLRYIQLLVDDGIVTRAVDPRDATHIHISLSADGRERLATVAAEVIAKFLPLRRQWRRARHEQSNDQS